jgi:dienelactone hydrolase
MIQTLMHKWERQLSLRDKNRTTLPFEWGLDFLDDSQTSTDPKESLFRFNRVAIPNSPAFFAHQKREYTVSEKTLQYRSSITSPYDQNNLTRCRIYEAKDRTDRAVIVLPQWNANETSHVALSRLLARLGMTTLRLTLPYHEERNPVGPRADYMVSPNLGRTIQAIRQAVLDARNAADWLQSEGYSRIGLMGTSVGSCISFLTFVHDPRFCVGVFNHVSSFFGDVVWHGISTQHVRIGIEPYLTKEELHDAWAVISPNSYVSRLRQDDSRKYLLISARYDLTFPSDLSHLLFEEHHRHGIPYDVSFLPCGHYTSAITPFKHRVGYLIANYFRKHL